MFSGIVEDLGEIKEIRCSDQGATLTIRTALATAKIKIGDSICTSGVCLTVTAKGRGTISMEVSAETLRRSTLATLQAGARVNLERSLTLGSLIGGHLVAGHVDGTGRLLSIRSEGDSKLCTFEAHAAESRYLVEKGSVTLDGVSLTVFDIEGERFKVALIPHTLAVTTLGAKAVGDPINYESDLLGKYIEKFVAARFEGRGGVSAGGQAA